MNAATTKKSGLLDFPVSAIVLGTENNLLYDQFGIANADDRALAISIRDNGIHEPLVLSGDGVLLSGHRRFAAAKYLGLHTVPVRLLEVMFSALDTAQRLDLLSRFNQQREKSPGERIREKLLDIEPADAHRKLQLRRAKLTAMEGACASNVVMGARKTRPKITTLQFLAAAQRVVQENKLYWPLTVRRVHYLLLNDPPLRHDKKPGSAYVNNKKCYDALTGLLSRARLTGQIPMQAIEDETRPILLGGGFESVQQFVAQETENFLAGYSRNLMQGQPHHIEIMLEKNALKSVVEAVAREYCIPVTTGRGFASLPPRSDLCRRFKQSGKDKLVLLMLTDHDPDGDAIAASFARSLRDDFGIEDIYPVKVALTAEDVKNHNLPSDMDAKPTSSNYKKFVAKHGAKAVELDACPVKLLQSTLRERIHSVIDVEEFNRQLELEKADAVHVEAHRRIVLEAIGGRHEL